MKKSKVLLFGAAMLVLGMVIMAGIDHWPMIAQTAGISSDPQIVVVADYPNQSVVEFVLTEPIAPFYFVEEGDVKMKEWITDPDRQKKWDPLQVGVDDALVLMDMIRQGVSGLEGGSMPEGIYANGYTVRVYIAKSHLGQRGEIIAQVLEIIEDFEASGRTVAMASSPAADPSATTAGINSQDVGPNSGNDVVME